MIKTQVIKIRDTYKNAGITSLEIYCDNARLLYDGIAGVETVWDDANEIITCIRKNTDHNHGHKDVKIVSTAYEHIQYISAYATPKTLPTYLDELSPGLKDNILETFK